MNECCKQTIRQVIDRVSKLEPPKEAEENGFDPVVSTKAYKIGYLAGINNACFEIEYGEQ